MTAFSKKYYRSLAPLFQPQGRPGPVDWSEVFGQPAPLELEIGFGNGEYLHRASLEHPDRQYLGAELAWASIKRALRRLAQPPRCNVRVMRLPGQTVLEYLCAPDSLDLIRCLFPLPWPESPKKRLFNEAFLNLAADRLSDSGHFIMVTDSETLAQWTREQASGSTLLLEMAECPSHLNTKYERRWQESGQRIFYHLRGRKKGRSAWPSYEIPMQACYLDIFDPQSYRPEGVAGDLVVKFKEFFYDPTLEQGLLRAFVVEGTLIQDFFIRICRQAGRWKVTPAIPGQVLPTQGLARALELAAQPPRN